MLGTWKNLTLYDEWSFLANCLSSNFPVKMVQAKWQKPNFPPHLQYGPSAAPLVVALIVGWALTESFPVPCMPAEFLIDRGADIYDNLQ